MKIKMLNEKGTKAEVPVEFYTEYKNKGFRPFKIKKMINKNGVKAEIPVELYDDYTKRGFVDAIKETPKVEEKGFLNSLADEANMLTATAGRSLNDLTELPANLLQMGYAGFKKGIDSLGNNAELGANPELGISADDIRRAQQSDQNYNPFDKENTLGQIARIPNTAFNKTTEGIRNLTGMDENKYYNDDKAYEENLRNANLLKKLVHGGIYYGTPGGSLKNMGNAAKFGAVSTGIQEATGANPIVADLATAIVNPLDFAKNSIKRLKNPKEKILYPIANKVFLGKKFNSDKAEVAKELMGDNAYVANMFTEGANRPQDYYLRNLGGENYLQKQKNADLELQNIINKIGENISPNSNDKSLNEQIQRLYNSAREGAKNTLTIPKNTREYIQNQRTTTFNPETKAAAKSNTMKEAESLIDQLSWYDDDRLVNAGKLINEYQARNQDLAKYFKDGNIASNTDSYYKTVKGSKNALKQDINDAGGGLEWLDNFNEANELYNKGKTRDKFDKHYHNIVDYATGDTRLSNLSKKLNDPKQRKIGDSFIFNESDKEKIDKLAGLTQFITQNKRAADINPSGSAAANKKWFSTLSALGTLISIPQAIATNSVLPLSGLSPFLIKKAGEFSGNLMSDPKFLDYAIKVSKNPKDTKAKLALDAIIQKNTGLTTRQFSNILTRDSVNLLTNSDDSGQ